MTTLMPEWRRQVSQDAEVTKGGLRVAWFLMEHESFARDGCTLDNAAIGAATGMHAHSVANSITILRGLGHVACRGITIDDKRGRRIRPAYLKGGRDVGAFDLDALESSIVPPGSDPSTSDRVIPEPTSLEQTVAPVSELSGEPVTYPLERADLGSVSGSVPMRVSGNAMRHRDDPMSLPWQSDAENSWEHDLRQWKLPLRCQQPTCDRPTAFLCLETQKGFCRRHQKRARIPVTLSIIELSEL
jgi:hypothetical protein